MTAGTLRRVSFTVAGLPAPQGSKRAGINRYTGKPYVTEMSGKKLKTWRAEVNAAATLFMLESFHGVGRKALTGPVAVTLAFCLPEPKNKPDGWREWPSFWLKWPWRRPDKDKLERAVMDALTGPVLTDDAQVVVGATGKFYSGGSYWRYGLQAPDQAGVTITAWQIGDDGD